MRKWLGLTNQTKIMFVFVFYAEAGYKHLQ
jgi:hypothetical protein